jgi:CheY-like chemotaxis protein
MADESKRILVVDDLQIFLDLEEKFLRNAGYDVDTARSGREALEKARTYRPQLILLDLYMPGMDGAECCKLIKNDPDHKDIPVVIVTARGDEDRMRCIEAGCDGYLKKIITRTEFLAEIQRTLNAKVRSPSRCQISTKVSYAALDGPEQHGVALSLSAAGMFIMTEEPLAVGTILRLEFSLKGLDKLFKLSGEVVSKADRKNEGTLILGFDLHFIDIDASSSRQIKNYLEEQVSQKRSMSSTGKRRIVVADDSKFWRDKITTMLSHSGHEVIAVEDGESAIRLCMDSTHPVDLLVLDLVMPSVDGFAVALYLREEKLTVRVPIIGFTGVYSHEDFPMGPKVLGLNAILEKSASTDEFLFVFNKYLHATRPPQKPLPAPRVPAHLPAEYRCEDGRSSRCTVMNISATGAYISTSLPLEAGSDLSLIFTLPEGTSIRTSATVVWTNEATPGSPANYSRGMGVVFNRREPSRQAALERYVKAEYGRY